MMCLCVFKIPRLLGALLRAGNREKNSGSGGNVMMRGKTVCTSGNSSLCSEHATTLDPLWPRKLTLCEENVPGGRNTRV